LADKDNYEKYFLTLNRIIYQTATNKIFFTKPSKKKTIIGARSKPIDRPGRINLIGSSMDSVIVYNIIAY
jgi:hypothetical protein